MQSGVIFGYTGLINSMVERIESELGNKINLIATGGLARVILPVTERIDYYEENLTLEGLSLLAKVTKLEKKQ